MSVTCPDPTAPSFPVWTGLLGGAAFQPADGTARVDKTILGGNVVQFQYAVIFTDKPALAGHYGGLTNRLCENQRVQGERWLALTILGGNTAQGDTPYPTASPEAPFRFAAHDTDYYVPEGGTVGYSFVANRSIHPNRSNCTNPSERQADSGWLELTRIDDGGVAGSFQVTIQGETISGAFDVPGYHDRTGNPRTCVS